MHSSVLMTPSPGSSWLHCNQGGLVNSLMPLNLYGSHCSRWIVLCRFGLNHFFLSYYYIWTMTLSSSKTIVKLQARPVKSEACHRMVFMVYKLLRCCLGSSFTNNIYDDMPLRVVVKS
uniref:Uncharacterized protein n=1 Tax=Triticum urartu TaxID=4572 RepID=A0A8R7Q1W6_TRIUA